MLRVQFSVQCLEWLVRCAGGDPHTTAADGMSPIHAAAQAGQLRCLVWLVEKGGVSTRCRAKDGATPAHFAAASGEVSPSINYYGVFHFG